MIELPFATTNSHKVTSANRDCEPLGLRLIPTPLDIVEIQAASGEAIARAKAAKAYESLGKPVVVSDDSWHIPGLRGFPGPYMKDVTAWFRADDWLNLTRNLVDRNVNLHVFSVYQDASEQRLFEAVLDGILLTDSRGPNDDWMTVISFNGGKSSVAEERAELGYVELQPDTVTSWHKLAEWYVAQP